MNTKAIAKRIEKIQIQKGFKKYALGKAIGSKPDAKTKRVENIMHTQFYNRFLNNLEKGILENEKLQLMSTALGVEYDFLLLGK